MAERKLIERLTDAVAQFREPLPSKMLGVIETKGDNRPDFGRGYSTPITDALRLTGWSHYSTEIDYARELGSLDNSSLIMAIVNWTGVNLAEALPVVFKPDAKGVQQIELGHPASDLIRRPNPFFTWADYCQAGAFDWWMGDWYMKKVRADLTGELKELWYIPQLFIEPRWPNDGKYPAVPMDEVDPDNTFLTHYQYTIPGKSEPELIKKADMVHIKHGVNMKNPRKGVCVWEPVLTEVYGDNAVARFSATIMKNMGMVRYLLSPKDKDVSVTPEQAAHIKQQFIIGSTGANANTPMVNPVGIDAVKMSFSPQELDLKELRKEPQSRVAGVAGVPAILVQYLVGLEHGHYGAAYEQARQQGYESVIIPIQNHISEDLTWQVLPEIDDTKGAKIGFDISKVRVLQDDRDKLFTRECEALRSGGKTLNMFLTALGKDTIEGGDIFYVPRTSLPVTIDSLKKIANDPAALEGAMPAEQSLTSAPKGMDIETIAQLADIDRLLARLEGQMKDFSPTQG